MSRPLRSSAKPLSVLESTLLASSLLLSVAHESGATLDDARQVVRAMARLEPSERELLIATSLRNMARGR